MRPQNRKIHSKSRPVQQTKNYNCVYLSNQHIELEQRRPAHAKPDFNWLSGPRNGTWKRTCGISCLRSLAPMWRFAMQDHPGNIHQSFATPRYSATPCYILIQLPNVINTISKYGGVRKPSIRHLATYFPEQIPAPSRFTPRYSATPCYVLIQLPNVIDTISKRWRSKKAFNTSPCHIFSWADSYSIPF